MRIVEPQRTKSISDSKHKSKNRFIHPILLIATATFLFIGFFIYLSNNSEAPVTEEPMTDVDKKEEIKQPEEIESGLIDFSGNEFRILYDQLLLPNLDKVDIPPVITGNDVADTRIRKIAQTRGYRLRSSPTETLPYVDGVLMQPLVSKPWRDLKKKSTQEGLGLSITSGYRSIEAQRQLFLSRLTALGVSYSDIANGLADDEINETLVTTAAPGYSKHHTGYTIDFSCTGFEFENFKNSTCNDWLAADNFKIAKEHGFIPSYPPDADLQGPDPEAWEYVWVGTEVLYLE